MAATLQDEAARAHAAELHVTTIVIDGLVMKFGGWTDDLARGGQTAIHVTVDTFHSGFAETIHRLIQHRELIDRDQRLRLVRTTGDIDLAKANGQVGILLGFQNAKPFEDDMLYVRAFWELGIRIVQLTYNERNFVGDGCLEKADGGLSTYGRAVVREMNRLGMLVDLSHCGRQTALDAAACSTAPVFFTHVGASALTPNPRNKEDAELRAVADTGGVIGVNLYGPLCWDPRARERPTVEQALDHIDYLVRLVGVEHVGIGSDWSQGASDAEMAQSMAALAAYDEVIGDYVRAVGDGREVRRPVGLETTAGMANLTLGLVRRGYSDDDVRNIMGGNFLRVFESVWSSRD